MEARKSWALGVLIKTESGAAVDLTGAVITLVISRGTQSDSTPVINMEASHVADTVGHVRFNIQAEDTDLEPGDYETTVTLRTVGYSIVLAKGVTEILANTETDSINYEFADAADAGALEVWLHRRNVIKITAPPIYTKGNQGDKGDKGDKGDPGKGVAPGGAVGEILIKLSYNDYETAWANAQALLPTPGTYMNIVDYVEWTDIIYTPVENVGLSAAGTTEGMVPVAIVGDLWNWSFLNADNIVNGSTNTFVTAEDREKLDRLDPGGLSRSDWAATEEQDGFILNKPTLGTAAAENVEAFRAASWVPTLGELSDVSIVTELPETGTPGTFIIVLPGGGA